MVGYLYIDADEDHVALQYRERRGDLKKNENKQKSNCLITKLIYVYEGTEREAPQSKRHRLVNPHYFCGVSTGDGNQTFWDEVYEYIDSHYDLSRVKRIYVNSDGGGWIKAGIKRISGAVHVLDGYHLEKYMTKLTSHMRDSREDAAREVRTVIRSQTRKEFDALVDRLEEYPDAGIERMEEAREYILSNWSAAVRRLKHKDGVVGSSTEGHVSHVLSSRMSSRPMGWSVKGATKMAQLRAYYFNCGDMLELVRYQKRELPKAAGAEYDILSSKQILTSERSRHGELGKYMEAISHSLSSQNKKVICFNSHIWGL